MVSYSLSVSFKIKNFSNPGNGSISFKLPIHKSQHLSSIFSIPLSSIEEPISHSNFPGEIECSSDYVYTHYCKTKQCPLIPIRFLAIVLCSTPCLHLTSIQNCSTDYSPQAPFPMTGSCPALLQLLNLVTHPWSPITVLFPSIAIQII